MVHLLPMKPKDVIRILEKAGFRLISQKGSHRKYVRESIVLVVPYHTKDFRIGTLHHIIKQSGLSVESFTG